MRLAPRSGAAFFVSSMFENEKQKAASFDARGFLSAGRSGQYQQLVIAGIDRLNGYN